MNQSQTNQTLKIEQQTQRGSREKQQTQQFNVQQKPELENILFDFQINSEMCFTQTHLETSLKNQEETLSRQQKTQNVSVFQQNTHVQAYPKFNDIQKSIEVLKIIIPEVLDNELIETIFQRASLYRYKNSFKPQQRRINAMENNKKENKTQKLLQSMASTYKTQDMHSSNVTSFKNKVRNKAEHIGKKQMGSRVVAKKSVMQTDSATSKASQIQPKKKRARKNFVSPLDLIWDAQKQQMLIDCHQRTPSYRQISLFFKKMHPSQQLLMTPNNLRRKLFKIVRIALRQLAFAAQKCKSWGLELVRLDDTRMKYLLAYSQAREVKKIVLQFYTKSKNDTSLIRKAVLAVNAYVANIQNNKLESVLKVRPSSKSTREKGLNQKNYLKKALKKGWGQQSDDDQVFYENDQKLDDNLIDEDWQQ